MNIADSNRIELADLFEAYADCRTNKRNTMNALAFELDYEKELITLWQDINAGTYAPGRSIAFIVNQPVKREIFAADFRDRVVHHLLINKLNSLFERTFIYDSYACRKGRGTHFGIMRVDRFIRRCSLNYSKDCYVLRLDIQGFFMAIDKRILWKKLSDLITNQYHQPDKCRVLNLCHKILNHNPTKNCFIKGARHDWCGLPKDKSLFYSPPACGLPIGNLSSQIFANVYLNALDHFIKYDLGVRYYGRYVDDFILIHSSHEYLKTLIPQIADFLQSQLKLTLHPRKIYLQHYSKGVHFLGAMIKPNHIKSGKRIKGNFYCAIDRYNQKLKSHQPNHKEQVKFLCSINSYLGIMSHYHTFHLRQLFLKTHLHHDWWQWFQVQKDFKKIIKKSQQVC